MFASLRRHAPVLLLGLIAFFGALSFGNLWLEIGQPFGGYFANHNENAITWKVDAATAPWWPGVAPNLLHYNDTLVTIDGQPYGGHEARTAYAQATAAQKTSVWLGIVRAGQTLTVEQPLFTFKFSEFLDLRLPDFIVGLSFWLLAIAVYRVRPFDPLNRLFAVAMGLTTVAFWSDVASIFPDSSALTRIQDLVFALATPFIGITLTHLALLFPKPMRLGSQQRFQWLYVLFVFVVVGHIVSLLLRWNNTALSLANGLSGLSNQISVSSFGVCVVVYLLRLGTLFVRRDTSRRTRRQAAPILFGMVLVLPYTFILITRVFGGVESPFFTNALDLRYLILAVPLTFALVLLRYQTSQSTHPLLVVVFNLATSAFIANVVAWGLNPTQGAGFAALFSVALLVSFFWSTQTSWQGLFSRFFQWERRSYSAVRQFGQQVVTQTKLTQLPEAIAEALVMRLELERSVVWLWDDAAQTYTLAGQAGEWRKPPPPFLTPGLAAALTPIRLTIESESLPHWLIPVQADGVLEVIAPLSASGQPVGLLGLGKRWDEEIFDERDLEILDLIAQQSALFLLTARQIEQLRQVPHQVAAAQERERFMIAQELHDTVQQFLGRLPFYLQVGRDAARKDPAETESILQRCITDVESAAQTVRQIRNSLAPLQLEKNLTQPLQMLVEHFRARNDTTVQISIAPDVDTGLSLDARHALYRVVQQALDNITEHAHAQKVSIVLTRQSDRISFVVADDGIGVSEQQRAQAESEGSFGLKSMRARITSLGGEFTLQSAAGQGTQVSGWLPCVERT